ncbi:hypothetical protein Hanom_Chr10g00945671 [Helianthus anomalus]
MNTFKRTRTRKSRSVSVHEHVYFLNKRTRTRPCSFSFGSFTALTSHPKNMPNPAILPPENHINGNQRCSD